MTKSQKSQPGASIKAAFTRWLTGESFVALKKRVGKPLMAAFTTLAGATTWKQAKAQRDRQVRAARKERAA